jgi:hypothetical protein
MMTPEQRAALVTSISIARSAPDPPSGTYRCLVPALLVEQLRRDLEACGINWRHVATQ